MPCSYTVVVQRSVLQKTHQAISILAWCCATSLQSSIPPLASKHKKTNLVCRRLCEFLAFPNTSPNFVVLIQPAVKYPHKDSMTLKEQQSLSSSQSIAIATCYLGIVFPRTALPVLTFAFPCFQGHAFLQWGVLSPVADANFR